MQKKELSDFLDSILKPAGFRRKGANWKRQEEELTKIVNLQKSSFGNQYFINYGFDINGLNYDGTAMHVFRGLTMDGGAEARLLDFDNVLDNENRRDRLTQKLQELLVGELKEVNTVEELKKHLQNREHLNDVALKVKEFLGLPIN